MKTMNRTPAVWPISAMVMLLGGGPAGWADGHDEIPFDDANIYFELNNTDGDLGFHSLFDGEPWKLLQLEDPYEREILKIKLRGRLRMQGLTELFYESAEPPFAELAPEVFFERFPEGDYEVEGITLEGEALGSTVTVTHLMPAPPVITVNTTELPGECLDVGNPVVNLPLVISWDEVTLSHPELGRTNEPIEVENYQVVLENLTSELTMSVDLSAEMTSLSIPTELAAAGDEFKVEVLVREESGNQTATESCFEAN